MHVIIRKCNDLMLWYADKIDEVYWVFAVTTDYIKNLKQYWVRDGSGYSNWIYETDCEPYRWTNHIVIKSCSNPVLWYYDKIGQEFEVSMDTDKSYWVRTNDENNPVAWVYKTDCEVL